MVRLLETFFRHKLVLLLPPLLIPLLVTPPALLTAPIIYETYAGIWVDRPTYLSYNDGWNRYITPAQNQSSRLSELLRTRSFLDEVAKRTSLAPLVGSPRGEERIQEIIGNGLTIYPSGTNLLVLRFHADTSQLAFQLLNAILEAFRDNSANDRINQAALATSFYQSSLEDARAQLQKAQDALRQYLASNPQSVISGTLRASTDSPSGLALSQQPLDPELAELQRAVDFAQSEVEHQKTALDQASLDASASLQGQELGFQVVDEPQQPTSPVRQLRSRLIFPAAGLVVGLLLSAVLLVLLMAGDRVVRAEADLGPGGRVLGVLPSLKLKRLPRRAGPEATRRGIAFAAGAALPAPGGTTK
jgi:uncharacterized protein involved in exopolysaccharide biosynthesis